jgi:ABC-type Na+ efflux pump permease subunit
MIDITQFGGDAAVLGVLGAFAGAALIFGLAMYVFMAIVLMALAKKTKTKNGWLAWIPIANIYLMTQIAGLPGWWTLMIFLPIVPVIGSLAMAAATVYIWWKICERRKFPGPLALLWLIPPAGIVLAAILAWAKK